jgi:hypothetical protein
MKPHPRIRKTIKWGGAAVTLLLVVAWAWSGRYTVGVWWASPRSPPWEYSLALSAGSIQLIRSDQYFGTESGYTGVHRHRNGILWRAFWRNGSPMVVLLPLWFVAAPSLLTTVLAWRLDALARRRARLGFCPICHYDRTGLAEPAICPECGGSPRPTPPSSV